MERRGLVNKAWAALLVLGWALVPAVAQAQSNPGFDCRKATTLVEKLICSDPDLGDARHGIGDGDAARLGLIAHQQPEAGGKEAE